MGNDPTFVAHVLDLVAPLGAVTARPMFGGHGLYAQGVMFGLLDDGELYLKSDAESRSRFVEAGCRQWVYSNKKVRMENTSYYRPPDEAHEDPEGMLPWARLALDAALRARSSKVAKGPSRGRGSSPAARPGPALGRGAKRRPRVKGSSARPRRTR